MNLYVGNLSYRLTNEELSQVFEEFGEVASARVMTDRETGKARGFGFVEMPNDEEALNAIDQLNGQEVSGRKMVVNESRPKKPRR